MTRATGRCVDCGLYLDGRVSHHCEALDDYDDEYALGEARDRCISCGAEVDHYLGCPDDPSPDYEAEASFGAVYGAGCSITQRRPPP